jgi:very-short-patch-repair endonuclease
MLAAVPRPPYRPRELQWQAFRGSAAVQQGVLTPHQLRSQAWIMIRSDIYADSRLERDHRLACHAAVLKLPPDATFAGPSAAYLMGVEHAATFTDPVHVIVPAKATPPRQRGVRSQGTDLAPDEVVAFGDLRHTSAARTAWDVAQWLDIVPAVAIVDGLLAQAGLRPEDFEALIRTRAGRRGSLKAARACSLADAGAQSPPESHLRVKLVLAGFPRPVTQHPVRLPSGLVLHPDLAWPKYRVAAEYDGRWHGSDERLDLDRTRLNDLAGAGWLVIHVTSRGLYRAFPRVVADVRAALESRGWRS